MLKKIKNGIINNVVVYKIDRLTRSTRDLIDLIEFFNEYDCSFNSLNELIDTKSSTGRMFIKIIGIFAEFERENIIERVKLGLERKVKEGYSIASKNISYGYDKKKGSNIQVINKEEAKVVKLIYSKFINGETYSEIARYLNLNNIKTKNNNSWSYKTIKLLLMNPNYVGKVRYGINTSRYFEVNGKHCSIIDSKLYNLVQNKILHYKINDSIFKDKIFCACGLSLTLKINKYISKKNVIKIYYRYVCKNKLCSFFGISESNLEILFSRYTIGLFWKSLDIKEKRIYLNTHIKKIVVYDNLIKELVYCDL